MIKNTIITTSDAIAIDITITNSIAITADRTDKIFFLTNFNSSKFFLKIQPSCFPHPSKPAFLLFPTLNFPLSLPLFQTVRPFHLHLTFPHPMSKPFLSTDIKLELSTPFYKVAPTRTQSPQNLFGTISDDSRNLSQSAEILHKQFFFSSDELFFSL